MYCMCIVIIVIIFMCETIRTSFSLQKLGCRFPSQGVKIIDTIEIASPKNFSFYTTANKRAYISVKGVTSSIDPIVLRTLSSEYSFSIRTLSCPLNASFLKYLEQQSDAMEISFERWVSFCGTSINEVARSDLNVFDEHSFLPIRDSQAVLYVHLEHISEGILCTETILYFCCVNDKYDGMIKEVTFHNGDISSLVSNFDSIGFNNNSKYDDLDTEYKQERKINEIKVQNSSSHRKIDITSRIIAISIGIKSCALNSHLRAAARRTYLQKLTFSYFDNDNSTHVIFLPFFIVGDASHHSKFSSIKKLLFQEQSLFGDLLLPPQINADDSYFSLTEKTSGFLRWLISQDLKVDFVVISDDDTYIDLSQLAFTLTFADVPTQRYYAGEAISNKLLDFAAY